MSLGEWMRQVRRLIHQVSLWVRRHRQIVRYVALGLAAFTLLTVVLQLAYPAGRLLPFVEIQDKSFGGQSTTTAAKQLDKDFAKAKLTVKTDKKAFTKSIEEIGIEVRGGDTARSAAKYTLVQRLIPFSSLAIMMSRDTPTQMRYDDERLRYFAQQVSKEGFVPAVDASVAVKGTKVELVPAKPSKDYSVQNVEKALREAHFSPKTEVSLTPKVKAAERTDEEVKGVLQEAQHAVDTPLFLKLSDERITVDKATIGTWLNFQEDAQTKRLQLTLKTEVVQKYLESIQSKVYKAPGTTRIQLIDGREVNRTAGEVGRGIDFAKTIMSLADAVKKGKEVTLDVPIAQIAPNVVYERQYSNTDAGLAAMLAEIATAKGGYGISVMEIGGRSANANGSKRFVAASTYKLYVAYAVFKEIEAGGMSWSTVISSGRDAATCFEVMIVKSDNPCAKAFGDIIGWQKIEDMMRGLGLASTDLSPSLYTTANDLALFLYKLENGTLVSAADRTRLLDTMKRQIYRSGIPAGTGLVVADKVGFVDNVIHDAGIVYAGKGPYVMVIMTTGTWSGIADAARQINNFLR